MKVIVIRKDFVLFMCAVFLVSSCSSWRMIDKQAIETEKSKPTIQVNLVSGEILKAKYYKVQYDTLVIITPKTPFFQAEDRLIPFDQIIEVKAFEASYESIAFGALWTGLVVGFLYKLITEFNSRICHPREHQPGKIRFYLKINIISTWIV